jgi:hypothetical protein
MQMARMPNVDNRLLRLVGWLTRELCQQPVVYELVRTDGIRTDSSVYICLTHSVETSIFTAHL